MPRFTVTAYATTESRFDFEIEAETQEAAEARAQEIIDGGNDELIGEAFQYDCERGPLAINTDLTEELVEF